MVDAKALLEFVRTYKTVLVFIFTPIVLLPLPLSLQSPESQCAYVMILMAVYWITEVVHLAITSLIPLLLFPLLGLLSSKAICKIFLKDVSMLLFAGILVAIGVEHSNLHKRIALRILLAMGTQPRWLLLGFMVPTFILSMWVSNTATTAMMIPIAMAVVSTLHSDIQYDDMDTNSQDINLQGQSEVNNGNTPHTPGKNGTVPTIYTINSDHTPQSNDSDVEFVVDNDIQIKDQTEDESKMEVFGGERNMGKVMCLCIAYAANIGGIGSLTGTPPNLVLKDYIDSYYDKRHQSSPITFTSWMGFALPLSSVCLIVSWIWLQIYFLGFRNLFKCRIEHRAAADKIRAVIKKEYDNLGQIRFNEVAMFFHFLVLVALWFFRSPGFISGWGTLFKAGYATDATAAILVCTSLFIFPSRRPEIFSKRTTGYKSVPSLVDWKVVSEKMPWHILFILGGGFALAEASDETGLTAAIGRSLEVFASYPRWVINLLINTLVAGMTEFTSNTATTTLVIPIIIKMADAIGLNALYVTIPGTISASFAFMLPIATAPNAIVFSYGYVNVFEMVKCGVVMNVLCILITTLAANTYGSAVYQWDSVPWSAQNVTTAVSLLNTTVTTLP